MVAIAFSVWFYGPLAYGLWKRGFFDRPAAAHDYKGSSTENLKFIRTALLGYEESEGQFPLGPGWMDAIQNRLGSDDLKKGEAVKKLVAPEDEGKPEAYGYAFNDALSGKFYGDIKDPKTPMVFESGATGRNAHGDPAKLRKPGGLVITVGGDIEH